MKSTYKIELEQKGDVNVGILVPLEFGTNIPFEVKRMFYTYGVPKFSERGHHAYYNTRQVLICLSGSLNVRCLDGDCESIYELSSCNEALYISPKIWRTTFDHSSDALLLVLSSKEYDEADYIRNYNEFLEVVRCM